MAFDVLNLLLSGAPIGPIAGAEAVKFEGWQRPVTEYAKRFGAETPDWPSKAAHQS